ncbi:MAG TPA: phospholipase D family protein [Hydrogenophaga sp.]|uniref:phospholipase D family protein n=1 Tax=Hydrogenophaga sp. TaxID=1904254 RepID=UPI002BD88C54|nr:phospholipase D family protein [Hydrogenophaga sp.]HMN92634.1 phospholipase D family protein [Hydrogenophaga sp.]HMP09217.1 phospholipase D family protein [Hydrogenophaga sp.]
MLRRLRWPLKLLLLLLIGSMLSVWSWGRFATRAQGEPSSALFAQADATALDRLLAGPLLARPGDSGAALVTDNLQAFALRAITAREAGRSLDAMYYIWRGDLTGNLLKYELLAAAERGVRVRLLIDDMNGPARDPLLLAMDTHPLFEVRLFNPTRNRATAWRRALEKVMRFVGFNRRMHNKAWIADNRLALVGGRNIGDEYFDAAPNMNFHDADLLLAGPAVEQASAVFDRFWNSAEVIPLRALRSRPAEPEKLPQWRAQLYADARASSWVQALGDPRVLADRLRQEMRMHWTPSLRVLSDPPEKAAPLASRRERADWLLYDLMQLLFSAHERSWLMSPYFVPGDPGVLLLTGQAARGVDVKVITNSLAATDVPVVHAGYQHQRAPLLSRGVRLYELKPSAANINREILGSSGASLHTKAFVIDGRRGFVGSFNFDPRSAQLNTEMGVLFDHAPLAAELEAMFVRASEPDKSWQLSLDDTGALRWHEAGQTHGSEPQTPRWLRVLVHLLGWLPIESQL